MEKQIYYNNNKKIVKYVLLTKNILVKPNYEDHYSKYHIITHVLLWLDMKSSLYEAMTREISPRKPLQPQSINSKIS